MVASHAGDLEYERLDAQRTGLAGPYRGMRNALIAEGAEAGLQGPADPDQYALYVAMRLDGVSHLMAEMLALQSPPMSNTDREFLEGQGGCYDQFQGNEFLGNYYGGMAKKAGVDTAGKVYLSGLAAFPGDPRAWVAGRGDAQRVCEDRGWSCDGSVKVRGEIQPRAEGKYQVADDLVAERAERLVAKGEASPGMEALEKARTKATPVGW